MQIPTEIINRKGAIKFSQLDENIVLLLSQGTIASVNLTEWLAVDHVRLVEAVLPLQYKCVIIDAVVQLKQKSAMQSIIAVGSILSDMLKKSPDRDLFTMLSSHISDSVRCWAAYIVGMNSDLAIDEKLIAMRPFAADTHFGVREIAWMASRASIEAELQKSIEVLSCWACDGDANVRRFASEATRPRGVWCKHIDKLKSEPQLALPILEPLKADSEKYVQDSVANWLNDASKTNPDWVKQICEEWLITSPDKTTQYIVKKALRTVNKKG